MKILVTGANGYMGQGIVKQLLDHNQTVIATDFSVDHVDERATRISGNLFEVDIPYEHYGKPDVLLHLAWRDGFRHYAPSHMEDLPKHLAFITKMVEAGISQVAVLGSMHEVGFFEGSINESTPTNPQSLYGVSKNALRQAVALLKKDYDFTYQWIRGYYIVGNVKYGCSIFSKIAEAVEQGKKTFPFTTGENQYDFLDYDEFCEQVAAVVMQNKVNGIINCCSGKPMKLAERVEQFIKENNYDIALEYGAFPDRPYDSKAVWGNNDKISQIMGN